MQGASITSLCFSSPIQGHSGPASFQGRLAAGLEGRSVAVGYLPGCRASEVLLIIGGTRRIPDILRAKRSGVLIVQRLNGMNWIHRRRPTGLRHFLKAEWANLNLRLIRSRLADAIVYQSRFVEGWWRGAAGESGLPQRIIYNGVPLDRFHPGQQELPDDPIRILVVEGRLGGGYEIGLGWAVELADGLRQANGRQVRLAVAGVVPPRLRENFAGSPVEWLGVLSEEQIVDHHHRAHFLFASDLHPACPNSVLEAMACGTPVLAFDTGAMAELVDDQSGVLVGYGADPWQAERPDISGLVEGGAKLLDHRARLRGGARRRAEMHFGAEAMVENYLAAFREWSN